MSDRKALRCAIYTRKSSEEGLEQDFNSLEAHREACGACIRGGDDPVYCPVPARWWGTPPAAIRLAPDQVRAAVNAGQEIGIRIGARGSTQHAIVRSMLRRVTLRPETLRIVLGGAGLRQALTVGGPIVCDNNAHPPGQSPADDRSNYQELDEPDIVLSTPLDIRRRGVQMKLLVDGDRTDRPIEHSLVTVVARAFCWAEMLTTGAAKSIREIAEREGLGEIYVGQVLPLGFLSPALVEQVLAGTQPPEMTSGGLSWSTGLPVRW